jgi:P4 family phage/plasmid primase-like protien
MSAMTLSYVSDRTLVRDLAALILAQDFFARSPAGEIFHYRAGVYRTGADFFIRQRVKHLVLQLGRVEKWNRRLAEEVTEFILLDTLELETTPSLDFINLENGLLNIWSGELLPHSPNFLSTIRIPIRFDAQADCPNIEEFIGEVFPRDSIELGWEVLGDLLTPDRSIQKAICLVGEGGNGKGVFSQLAVRFVGADNVTHLSLQKFEKDRFAVAGLYQKLANICADLPSERLQDSSVFKAITGCDRISGEFKYRNAFEFTPFARLVFSANHFPASKDASTAYFDRWLVVPFDGRFRGTARENPRKLLDARLSSSRELSGALNRALPALRRVRQHGRFTETQSTRQQWKEFQGAANPLALWLEAETVSSGSALITKERLHAVYALDCLNANRPVMTKQMFGRALKRLRPELEEVQREVDGARRWIYLGIGLRNGRVSDGSGHSLESLNGRNLFANGAGLNLPDDNG